MKKIVVLGSTGSIGENVLNVIRDMKEDFELIGLSANRNINLLAEQIKKFSPRGACVMDKNKIKDLKALLGDSKTKILSGEEGLVELACSADAELVVVALVGAIGLKPILASINEGKDLAIANKEPLVIAGRIIMQSAKKKGVKIIPIDSEPNAIFQVIEGKKKKEIGKLILTASGGPFLGASREKLRNITPEEAIKHPRWKMGKKISVDSATLMNKTFEVIEASYLFEMDNKDIEVVVHPESIVHSMVEFVDGEIIAVLSKTDMRIPIKYALTYPERVNSNHHRISLTEIGKLSFLKPDYEMFPALKFGYDVLERKGTFPAVLNAADEVAVSMFLERKIGFTEIVGLVDDVLKGYKEIAADKDGLLLEDILNADKWARSYAGSLVNVK